MPNENQNSTTPKYPLANDVKGAPFDPPLNVVAWRVFKLARKAGRPKVILDSGRPLELALATPFEEFADAVGESGRYRLEGIDAQGQLLPGCVAVTELVIDDEEAPGVPSAGDALPVMVQLVERLVASNVRVVEAMASAFGQVRPATSEPVIVAPPERHDSGEVFTGILKMLETLKGQKNGAATPPPPDGGASS